MRVSASIAATRSRSVNKTELPTHPHTPYGYELEGERGFLCFIYYILTSGDQLVCFTVKMWVPKLKGLAPPH